MIVVFAYRPSGADNLLLCDVDGVVVPSGDVGKCLEILVERRSLILQVN